MKNGIQVPTFEENNFKNMHTSYIHDFAGDEHISNLLGVENIEDGSGVTFC